jgi:hypothetical protein
MRRLIYENGLAIAMLLFFTFALAGQIGTGWVEANDDRSEHGEPAIALSAYLSSGHFVEALFENWESEFLQMGALVVLTIRLRQRGSPESKPLDGDQPVDREPDPDRPRAPWPVRRGGLVLKVYDKSLSLALFALFAFSFAMHAIGGAAVYNEERAAHGSSDRVTPVSYLATTRMWFESFQNWQSEFMSVGALIVLGIVLRQKGSPESKPVDHPHDETGSE